MQHTCIIGIGNDLCGDDAVGPMVVRQLRDCAHDAAIYESTGAAMDLLLLWQRASYVIIVDAVVTGAKAGTIYRVNAGQDQLPATFLHPSSHALGVTRAIELARILHELPPQVVIYGIEGANWALGADLSAEVACAAAQVVERIRRELAEKRGDARGRENEEAWGRA